MSRIREHQRRMEQLEAVNKLDHRIAIYVDDRKDLHTRIDELIAAGALAEEDRPRCVFWLDYRHHSEWQSDDEATRRLDAQARITLPSVTGSCEADARPPRDAPDAAL